MPVDIGEKIKQLRLQRKMTQSELAGDQITRNMLSRVENGAALPSLPTVWYLAERLEVPAGFLLAEGKDDRIWRKMNRIESIRRMLTEGDARICMQLCQGEDEDGGADDEIYLIMAQCSLKLAVEAFEQGRLHKSCAALDDALEYADRTVYDTYGIRAAATLYFRFMHKLSPMLYSEKLTDVEDLAVGSSDAFGQYVLAMESLEAGEMRRVEYYLSTPRTDAWSAHFRAHISLEQGDYEKAYAELQQLLHSEQAIGRVLMYSIFCDMETCCRELEDYKGAYEYAQNKVTLLEKMLQK